MTDKPKRRPDVTDWVAIILALGLSAAVILILVATMVQIFHNERPEVSLSDNATSILLAAISGLSGLLGGYLGYGKRKRDDNGNGKNNGSG